MPVINVLSPHLADMIAAGEVVERPASVVKELTENALDAGAKNITVEIKNGGTTYIRVTDDGCGMAPEDAGVAFLRHATSKLHDEEGLTSIETMGFRGEALAAISAVSHIELTTRRRGDSEGTRVTLDAGEIEEMSSFGCPEGTTMIVRELFYNTPARLKFMKSDRSESSACVLAALRCALSHPEVSVRFLRDGTEEFFSPGDGRIDSAIYTLLGRETSQSLLPCGMDEDGVTVNGYTSSPAVGRGNRSLQFFFCNGRCIKSPLLQSAVEQAYRNTLLTGRYPSCVLYLTLDAGSVDVNVHPAKTEVRFSYEKQIFDTVYRAVSLALNAESVTEQPETRKSDFYQSMTAKEYRESLEKPQMKAPQTPYGKGNAKADFSAAAKQKPVNTISAMPTVQTVKAEIEPKIVEKNEKMVETIEIKSKKPVEKAVETVEKARVPQHRIVGEALKTYIVVECESQLLLIDKHAAHERMIFDALKAQEREIVAQTLLTPESVRLDGESAEQLVKNAQLLYELGFEIEDFGQDSFLIRAVPADMAPGDAAAALEEICEKLKVGKALDPKSARDEILHTAACKAAIKAGWNTEPQELERLVAEVLSGRVKYCPHGRPVAVTLTKKELDKMFKRIV